MGRKRKFDQPMTDVIQLKVTKALADKFDDIPQGLDYLRTCIDTWSEGDDAKVLEAIRQTEEEIAELTRRVGEMRGRLSKKVSGEEQVIARTVEEFKRWHIDGRNISQQRSWVLASVEDAGLFQKVMERLYPGGMPEDEEFGG